MHSNGGASKMSEDIDKWVKNPSRIRQHGKENSFFGILRCHDKLSKYHSFGVLFSPFSLEFLFCH